MRDKNPQDANDDAGGKGVMRRKGTDAVEDAQIVDLYWSRNEKAIDATEQKYGRMLRSLSFSCLSNREDAEECVNDTYLAAWQSMPTDRPAYLGAYLSKITRRISIDRFRHNHREKRGGLSQVTEELSECLPDTTTPTPAEAFEQGRLREILNGFLASLPAEKRIMFVQRYFYAQPLAAIAKEMGLSESNVKVILYRVREHLRHQLEKEGLL